MPPLGVRMSSDIILETEDLTKEFAGFIAVNGVSLRVKRRTIHALIGPNGAGKTTCFNMLTKFLSPTRGRIVYNGHDITALPPAEVARLGLVRSFQISAVFPHMTVLENVRIALQRQRGGSFDFWRSASVLDRFNERAMALIEDVGLTSSADWAALELPYGRTRALEIATTIALDPEILLLDEPTAAQSANEVSPTSSISAIARSLNRSRTEAERQKSKEPPRWRCSAMRTFSSTVICGNTAEIWNERTKPSRATSAGGSAVMSWPL